MLRFLLGVSALIQSEHTSTAPPLNLLEHHCHMEMLNEYLKTLLSSCSDELRLEPDKNPYLVAQDRTTDIAQVPLMGTQISTMVFPLIPADVKSSLPHSPEVEFVHPHNLGNFNFTVQKSPAGFIVTIRPLLADSHVSIGVQESLPEVAPAHAPEPVAYEAPSVPDPPPAAMYEPPISEYSFEPALEYNPEPSPGTSYDLESSSFSHNAAANDPVDTMAIADLIYEEEPTALEYVSSAAGGPEIETVSVNETASRGETSVWNAVI